MDYYLQLPLNNNYLMLGDSDGTRKAGVCQVRPSLDRFSELVVISTWKLVTISESKVRRSPPVSSNALHPEPYNAAQKAPTSTPHLLELRAVLANEVRLAALVDRVQNGAIGPEETKDSCGWISQEGIAWLR